MERRGIAHTEHFPTSSKVRAAEDADLVVEAILLAVAHIPVRYRNQKPSEPLSTVARENAPRSFEPAAKPGNSPKVEWSKRLRWIHKATPRFDLQPMPHHDCLLDPSKLL